MPVRREVFVHKDGIESPRVSLSHTRVETQSSEYHNIYDASQAIGRERLFLRLAYLPTAGLGFLGAMRGFEQLVEFSKPLHGRTDFGAAALGVAGVVLAYGIASKIGERLAMKQKEMEAIKSATLQAPVIYSEKPADHEPSENFEETEPGL